MPRSAASTRACGLISWAAKTRVTDASNGSRLSSSGSGSAARRLRPHSSALVDAECMGMVVHDGLLAGLVGDRPGACPVDQVVLEHAGRAHPVQRLVRAGVGGEKAGQGGVGP